MYRFLEFFAYCVYVRTVRKGSKKTNTLEHFNTFFVMSMELDFRGTSAHYMVAAYSIYHLVFEAYSRERTPPFFSNLAEIIPDMIYSQKNTEKEADISIYESTYKK